jgi:hypothetical protein
MSIILLQAFRHILSLPRLYSQDKVPSDAAQNPEARNLNSTAAQA